MYTGQKRKKPVLPVLIEYLTVYLQTGQLRTKTKIVMIRCKTNKRFYVQFWFVKCIRFCAHIICVLTLVEANLCDRTVWDESLFFWLITGFLNAKLTECPEHIITCAGEQSLCRVSMLPWWFPPCAFTF